MYVMVNLLVTDFYKSGKMVCIVKQSAPCIVTGQKQSDVLMPDV